MISSHKDRNILLDVENLAAGYGKMKVLRNISLQVGEAEIVSIIGANGAGKSTFIKALTGQLPSSGRIEFRGSEISSLSMERRVAAGIALVPEGRGTFANLTVEENLWVGASIVKNKPDALQSLEAVYERFPRLADRKRQTAGTLSGGEQQMLALGRALMSDPQLILMDEPSMGLAPILMDKVFEAIAEIHGEGKSVLLIEQNAAAALALSSKTYVFENGAIAIEAKSRDLMQNDSIREIYLGMEM